MRLAHLPSNACEHVASAATVIRLKYGCMRLPRVTPMPLARFDVPFEHPDWIFEPKMDGFRAVAYVEGGACRLVSRNRNAFKTFEPLAQAIAQELAGRSAILDGEIVHPGRDGRPMFYELMRRREPFCFYAFDLLWLDGTDLRERPLSERKTLLRKLLPRKPRSLVYVQHFASG